VRIWAVVLTAAIALGTARVARSVASNMRDKDETAEPYAPSPGVAPIVVLGYREAAADLFWIRLLGYWGGEATARGITGLIDAIVALDPRFHRIYVTGAHAMTIADHGVTQDTFKDALELLKRGRAQFPDDYKLYELAAEILTGDLKTTDADERRRWDAEGVQLMEAALRKPNAPATAATWAATMRTKLGQKQRAIRDLREMILLTRDLDARKKMIDKLAQLEDSDSADVASELYAENRRFESAWQRDRPAIPPSMYILLGQMPPPGFDLTDLATGGRDLFVPQDADPTVLVAP
jgi:hypothetical protein